MKVQVRIHGRRLWVEMSDPLACRIDADTADYDRLLTEDVRDYINDIIAAFTGPYSSVVEVSDEYGLVGEWETPGQLIECGRCGHQFEQPAEEYLGQAPCPVCGHVPKNYENLDITA